MVPGFLYFFRKRGSERLSILSILNVDIEPRATGGSCASKDVLATVERLLRRARHCIMSWWRILKDYSQIAFAKDNFIKIFVSGMVFVFGGRSDSWPSDEASHGRGRPVGCTGDTSSCVE